MLIESRDFQQIASKLVQNLVPKCEENVHKAIEFVFAIKGEEFIARAWAPSNYRQVWVKYPESVYSRKSLKTADYKFGWIMDACHDSGWTDGFNFRNYAIELDLKEIRLGSLPVTEVFDGFIGINEEKGDHLAPLTDKVYLVQELSYEEFLVLMVKELWQNGDSLHIDFDNGKKRRLIEVVDEQTLKSHEYRSNKKDEIAPLTAEGIKKLLETKSTQSFRFYTMDHNRKGCLFI